MLTNTWDSRGCGWQLKITELVAEETLLNPQGLVIPQPMGHRDAPSLPSVHEAFSKLVLKTREA